MDIVPRKLTHEQIQVLRVLGTQVISQLELRNHIKTSFKLQQDLFEKNKRLEELDKQRVRFLGMISHDLRQSVCAVQVSSEILLQGEPKEEHQELLESISNSSNYMGSLLDELLDELHLSKSIRNAPPIFKVVEPVSIIKRNVLANSRVAERKNIAISLTINDSVKMDGNLRINMDVSKMERVLNNLISNAMKFSHSGTNIRVHLKKSNSHFKIQVEDEGQGIPKNEISKLFDGGTTSVVPTGNERSTGLGLKIVKEIIEQHKGTIKVYSQVGIGTIFTISLPIVRPTISESVTTKNVTTARSSISEKKRLDILIAEDNSINRKVLTTALSKEGHNVTVVVNGEEAVESVKKGKFDVILMDKEMPVMDGITAARIIKENKPEVPILSISGSTIESQEARAHFQGFLTKPYNLQQLVQVVEHVTSA